jgi:hypothetical protein
MESAAREAPRPYHFVILSDHGQSAGATFKQRYHMTLEDLVQQLAEAYRVGGDVDVHEDWNQVNVFLTEAVQHDQGAVKRPLRQALKGSTQDDQVMFGPEGEALSEEKKSTDEGELPQILVLASGNLGLVYGTRLGRRVMLEEIETVYPGLLDGLADHGGPNLPGRGPGRGREPAGRFWPPRRGAPAPGRQLPRRPGHSGQQLLQPRDQRGGRLRGVDR